MVFGNAIRSHREALGLTLNDLALPWRISGPALSLIETGQRDLRVSSLLRTAAALWVSPATLLPWP